MKTAFPKSLKTGDKFCFKTVEKAVYGDDGLTVADHLSEVRKNVNTNTSNIANAHSRIDNLIVENTENTINADELTDIRTGQDGIAYATAGSAVRGQFLNVFNAIKELTKYTRNSAPEESDIYNTINTNADKTELYTGYVSFPYASTVSVPTGYSVKVALYNYNAGTGSYTEKSNSGWVNKYPIPKNTHIVISLKHSDTSVEAGISTPEISKTEIVALTFAEKYPAIGRNATLDKVGFYERLQYGIYTDNTVFKDSQLSTDGVISSIDNAVTIKAKEGYNFRIIRQQLNSDGEYDDVTNTGWLTEYFIPCNAPFSISFERIDKGVLYFDDFVNNFEFGYIHVDDPYLDNLINTVTGEGVMSRVDGIYEYGQTTQRLLSPIVTYDYPVTLYIDDIESPAKISYHIVDPDNGYKGVYDSGWTTTITIPAKLPVRISFKDDSELVDIHNMKNIKVRDLMDIGHNEFIKDIAYKGLSAYAPENTMVAFKHAKMQGFKYVFADVKYTSDNVLVLLHDDTIDRTARDSSGNRVTGSISSLTYNQVNQYDFGYWFTGKHTNIKIPTFDEFIKFCKKNGLHPYIHFNFAASTTVGADRIHEMVDRVLWYGMSRNVTFASFQLDNLRIIKERLPFARICFMSNGVTDYAITSATSLKTDENEVVISSSTYSAEEINKCRLADIPLEVFVIDDVNLLANTAMYISGAMSTMLQIGKLFIQDDDVEVEEL